MSRRKAKQQSIRRRPSVGRGGGRIFWGARSIITPVIVVVSACGLTLPFLAPNLPRLAA